MLNLHAPIQPGMSAAGFQLGQRFSDIHALLDEATVVDYREGFNLNRAINENAGILVVKGFGQIDDRTVYFGPGTVRLVFSSTNVLGCIYVVEGYLGSYRGAMIGSPLSSVSAIEPVAFDDGDEMYYRVDQRGEYLPGLAIVADVSSKEHEVTPIFGFCIHDWSIFRSVA